MNWGKVKAIGASYMHRKDMATRFDDIQALVMSDLTRLLDVTENEGAGVFQMAASDAMPGLYEAVLPDDFGRPKLFFFGTEKPLEPTTLVNMYGNNRRDQYAVAGRKVFTRRGGALVGSYGQRIEAVSADTGENVFMRFYPTAVVYSLLVHACNSIQDFEAVGPYQVKLDEAIGAANLAKAWADLGPGAKPQSSYANP